MSAFLKILAVIFNVIAIIVNAVTNFVIPRRKPTYPVITNPILKKSLTDLLEELKQRKITSREIVDAYISRIKEVNSQLNAVVEDRFDDASKDAQHADSLISKTKNEMQLALLYQRYPLLGLPFTVKEACGLKGLSHTVGSVKRKYEKCAEDSDVVALLKAAGGIPLLVSANPEFCLAFEADTHVNGKCLNPYDLRRSSGGSSSGEGSLHGAGASLFGVVSDISGSIRLPALFCGVFGHKPTGGLLSVRGHFPYSHTDPGFSYYLQYGVMTRFARDMALLMHIMAAKNAEKLKLFDGIKLNDIKIHYTFALGSLKHVPADFEIKLAIKRAVKCFEKGGLQTEELTYSGFQNVIEMCLSSLVTIKGMPSVITHSAKNRPSRKVLIMELLKSFIGHSTNTSMPLFSELMIDMDAFLSAEENEKLRDEIKRVRTDLIELLGTNGVLFVPTYHKTANFFHGSSIINISGVVLMLLFNILGFPATHVPMGLDRNGLPVGFQVVAAPYMDKLCLQIASELDGAFGGWVEYQ